MSQKALIRLPLKVEDNDPIGREVVLAKATDVPRVGDYPSQEQAMASFPKMSEIQSDILIRKSAK